MKRSSLQKRVSKFSPKKVYEIDSWPCQALGLEHFTTNFAIPNFEFKIRSKFGQNNVLVSREIGKETDRKMKVRLI